jgi:hypothetical protein
MGGIAAIHASQLADLPNFRLPVLPTLITENGRTLSVSSRQKIDNAIRAIEDFLGGKGKVISNADGDIILMRGDKKIRFDIRDPHGDKPHFHLEQRTPNGKWVDVGSEHRYYFIQE